MTTAAVQEVAGAPADSRYPPGRCARTVPSMAHEDDGELMQRFARGDLRAFEALHSRHRTALYRYLLRHTRDPDVTSDLFQEVWSRVIASRARYEPRARFRTFLFRIAHRGIRPVARGDRGGHGSRCRDGERPERRPGAG